MCKRYGGWRNWDMYDEGKGDKWIHRPTTTRRMGWETSERGIGGGGLVLGLVFCFYGAGVRCEGGEGGRKERLNYSATHRNPQTSPQLELPLASPTCVYLTPSYTRCGLEPLFPKNTMGTARNWNVLGVKIVCDSVCMKTALQWRSNAVQTGMTCDYTKVRYKLSTAVIQVWHEKRLHEAFTPARTLLRITANNNLLMCVQRSRVLIWGGRMGFIWYQLQKVWCFSQPFSVMVLFTSPTFPLLYLKLLFCLSNVRNSQKSELNVTTKASPAVLKDTPETPTGLVCSNNEHKSTSSALKMRGRSSVRSHIYGMNLFP